MKVRYHFKTDCEVNTVCKCFYLGELTVATVLTGPKAIVGLFTAEHSIWHLQHGN